MIHWKDGLNGTCRSLQFHLPSSEDALKWWGTRKEVVEEVRVQLSNHAQGLRSNEDVILHEIVGGQLKRLKPEDLKDWQLVESGLGRIAHLAQQRWKKEVGKHHIAFVKEAAKAFLKKKMYVTPQKASGSWSNEVPSSSLNFSAFRDLTVLGV